MIARCAALLPGLARVAALTLASLALQAAERRLFGAAVIESLVLAIVLGAAWCSLRPPPPRAAPGIHLAAHRVLEAAVALFGASVSARAVLAAGPALFGGIAAVVALSLGLSYAAGRALGLPSRLAALVACGNSICGNAAVAAVAPVIGAAGEDVAAAIGYTAAFGVATVLLLPLLGHALGMDALRYGAFAGLTVYAVPQVLAAAAPMGAAALQLGTVVKLTRVLMLGPVCALLGLLCRRSAAGSRPPLVPWFIFGFGLLLGLRGCGLIPAPLLPWLAGAANLLTIVAMAGLGLSTNLRSVAGAGPRVLASVAISLAALGAVSFALVTALGL